MNILVDKRTELMSIILALSQGNEYIEEHFPLGLEDEYRRDVVNHFSKYKDHKCIEIAKFIAKKQVGFSFDNPIRLAFSLDLNLQFNGQIENFLLNELEDGKLLKDFMSEIVKFAQDSRFVDFYDRHKEYYLTKIKEVESLFDCKKFVCELQKFLKKEILDNFEINIIPMLINSNHGFNINNTNIANIGLLSEDFKTIEPFNNGYNHIIIHEFCHNFVNCYTEDRELIMPEDFIQNLNEMGYRNPISYLNDTIVRAMTIRLRKKLII